jgi:hypothetical protein
MKFCEIRMTLEKIVIWHSFRICFGRANTKKISGGSKIFGPKI